MILPFLTSLILLAPFLPAEASDITASTGEETSPCGWSFSPVFGFISGGYVIDTPHSGDLVYGIKMSHQRSSSAWIDIGVNGLGRSGRIFFIHSRVNYPLLSNTALRPFVSTGAGLIASDSGGVFDFLYGGGLVLAIDKGISATQSYIIHYSTSQALSDEEGNPLNSFETSLQFWF